MVAEEREYGGEQAGRSSLTRSNEVLDSPEQRKRVVLYSFALLRGCCILFTTRLGLPTLSRQPEYISIVFDTKEMRREGGPLSRSRCGSAFGSWPPRAGTGWSRRLTQGLASSGLPGSLSTSD